jgi:predicted nucleotidyltransferase component of viral defense system
MEFAEKEFALTHMLQVLNDAGALKGLVFKGGTCIRKTLSGPSARLSTDLDFTALDPNGNPEDFVVAFHDLNDLGFHGFQFSMGLEPEKDWYISGNGDSVGFGLGYRHEEMGLEGEIRIQISHRAAPILAPVLGKQIEQGYFRGLGFEPASLLRLRVEEMLAEKIRALCQRQKTRDLYDLNWFAQFPHNRDLVRKLAVLKLWESSDGFDPERFQSKLSPDMDWDWDDLASIVKSFDPHKGKLMLENCTKEFSFLGEMTQSEKDLAKDKHARSHALAKEISDEVLKLAGDAEETHWDNAWQRGHGIPK